MTNTNRYTRHKYGKGGTYTAWTTHCLQPDTIVLRYEKSKILLAPQASQMVGVGCHYHAEQHIMRRVALHIYLL